MDGGRGPFRRSEYLLGLPSGARLTLLMLNARGAQPGALAGLGLAQFRQGGGWVGQVALPACQDVAGGLRGGA